MEGILLSIDRLQQKGIVDTRNDRYKTLTIYFGAHMPDSLQENCSVNFEVRQSAAGNQYAKFISVVERNAAVFNTEDRDKWYSWGEDYERDFIDKIVPLIKIDIRKNPEKETCSWAIDLVDFTHKRYADLKVQATPFFTAGSSKHSYCGRRYDPTYTVTFNKKDYEKYRRDYPGCDIYYWVNWRQLEYYYSNGDSVLVKPLKGVWRASFASMCDLIEHDLVSLHAYQHRTTDDHNAKESYLFDLSDKRIFTKLL